MFDQTFVNGSYKGKKAAHRSTLLLAAGNRDMPIGFDSAGLHAGAAERAVEEFVDGAGASADRATETS